MLKKKTAKNVWRHFTKLIKKISRQEENDTILLYMEKAQSFVKALELAEAIDYYTAQEMKRMIFEAEIRAYKIFES